MIILELMRMVLLTTLLCLIAVTDIQTRLIPKELLLEMVIAEVGYLLLSCFLKTSETKLYQILVPPILGLLVALFFVFAVAFWPKTALAVAI